MVPIRTIIEDRIWRQARKMLYPEPKPLSGEQREQFLKDAASDFEALFDALNESCLELHKKLRPTKDLGTELATSSEPGLIVKISRGHDWLKLIDRDDSNRAKIRKGPSVWWPLEHKKGDFFTGQPSQVRNLRRLLEVLQLKVEGLEILYSYAINDRWSSNFPKDITNSIEQLLDTAEGHITNIEKKMPESRLSRLSSTVGQRIKKIQEHLFSSKKSHKKSKANRQSRPFAVGNLGTKLDTFAVKVLTQKQVDALKGKPQKAKSRR